MKARVVRGGITTRGLPPLVFETGGVAFYAARELAPIGILPVVVGTAGAWCHPYRSLTPTDPAVLGAARCGAPGRTVTSRPGPVAKQITFDGTSFTANAPAGVGSVLFSALPTRQAAEAPPAPREGRAPRDDVRRDPLDQAREAAQRFATEYGTKFPKAVATLEKDADVLLTFFDFPPSTGSISARRT